MIFEMFVHAWARIDHFHWNVLRLEEYSDCCIPPFSLVSVVAHRTPNLHCTGKATL
jgi:hypothetical protein